MRPVASAYLESMADALTDTATQRPATGLNDGARELILRVVSEVTGCGPPEVVEYLFRDRHGGRRDYYEALESVWGEPTAWEVSEAVSSAEARTESSFDLYARGDPLLAGTYALLVHA